MVAVAHSEEEGSHAFETVLLLHGLGGGESRQSVCQSVLLILAEEPALQMATLHHELKVVYRLHLGGSGSNGLDAGLVRIVNKEHHVGQLDGCVLPDPDTGRNALQNGTLSGTDQGAGARGVVVLLQIHRRHQTVADLTVRLGALNVNDGILVGLKDVPGQIIVHGTVDIGDVLLHVGIVELALRQNEPQGGGGIPGNAVHLIPVLRLGGELVAGHHGPAAHIAVPGQQDVCGLHTQLLKFCIHVVFPP